MKGHYHTFIFSLLPHLLADFLSHIFTCLYLPPRVSASSLNICFQLLYTLLTNSLLFTGCPYWTSFYIKSRCCMLYLVKPLNFMSIFSLDYLEGKLLLCFFISHCESIFLAARILILTAFGFTSFSFLSLPLCLSISLPP